MYSIGEKGMSDAVCDALVLFLQGLQFKSFDETGMNSKPFSFSNVWREWPSPGVSLQYPTAVVLPVPEEYEPSSLTPFVMEETYNPADGSVLVKPSEFVAQLPITIWTLNAKQRDAVMEGLEYAFNPNLDQYGVFLTLPGKFSTTARFAMLGNKKLDTQDNTFRGELQNTVIVKCWADYVYKTYIPLIVPSLIYTIT